MDISQEQLRQGKVYSFPFSGEVVRDFARKKESLMVNISVSILFVATVISTILLANFGSTKLEDEYPIAHWILSGLMGLLVGVLAFVVSICIVQSISYSKGMFGKSASGSRIIKNWEDFSNWLTWEFNVKAVNIIPDGWNHNTAFTPAAKQGIVMDFKDTEGERYALYKLEDSGNSYVVVHFADGDDSYGVHSMTMTVSTVMKDGFAPVIIKKPEPVVKCAFQELLALPEGVSEEVYSIASEMTVLFKTLSECALLEGEFAGVNRVHEELDELSIMALQALPVGIDGELERLLVTGLACLRDELVSIRDTYKASVQDEVSARLELFNVLFQAEKEVSK